MTFDFDPPPERRNTDSQKWQKYAGRDILPLWVADMDFTSPPAIVAALHQRVDQGIFGYARPVKRTTEAIVAALQERYGWKIDPAWLVWLPGLVVGLNVCSRAFAEPGDAVMSLTPVYPPFTTAPRNQERKAQTVPLVLQGRQWQIDWDALTAAVTPQTRLFYLCHPHNPVARVWRAEELRRLGEFCARHQLLLISDEIHCDLILEPALERHLPAVVAAPEISARSVTLMAPSKTFNIPGLGTSFAIIPDAALRTRFNRACAGIVAEVTCLGFAACEAAYAQGEPWRRALIAYLRGNRDFLLQTLARDLPQIRVEAPIEATYLAWMNVEALGLPHPLAHFEAKGVGLSDGAPFGAPPGKYLRLNFGCPRTTLAEALRRMAT